MKYSEVKQVVAIRPIREAFNNLCWPFGFGFNEFEIMLDFLRL